MKINDCKCILFILIITVLLMGTLIRPKAAYAQNPFLEVKEEPGEKPSSTPQAKETGVKEEVEEPSGDKPGSVQNEPVKEEPVSEKAGSVKPAGKQQKQNWFLYHLAKLQKKLNRSVSGQMRKLKTQKSFSFFLTIMLICFVYGIAHALGPGHGKSIISSWILVSKRELKDVVAASLLTAVVHSMSATLLVLGSWYILKKTVTIETEHLKYYLQFASGILLFLLGSFEIYKYIRRNFIDKKPGKEEAGEEESKENEDKTRHLNSFAVALTAGIIPCPVTSLILIFAISMDLVWQGIVFVISFATGMALAILGVTWMVWTLKEKAKKTKFPAINFAVEKILPLMGGLALIVFAVIIMLTSKV